MNVLEFNRLKSVTSLVAAAKGTLKTVSEDLLSELIVELEKQAKIGRVTLPQKLYRDVLLQRKRLHTLHSGRKPAEELEA